MSQPLLPNEDCPGFGRKIAIYIYIYIFIIYICIGLQVTFLPTSVQAVLSIKNNIKTIFFHIEKKRESVLIFDSLLGMAHYSPHCGSMK